MGIGAVLAGASATGGLFGMLLGIFPPLLDDYTHWSYNKWPNKLPDFGTLIELRYRKLLTEAEYINNFTCQGLSPVFADKLYKMSEVTISALDYITLWRRGEIDSAALDIALERLRMVKPEIEKLKKVTEFFPAPADLIQFAVREVYSPEVVSRFGQMQDLPPKYISESKKAGIPEEQAGNYWAAHWRLPAAGQGYQMLHRRIIDEETLSMLLRALDVMPFWRDKMIQLSYSPLTRVDVRRMNDMGVLDDEDTYNAYLDRGYSPENADNMLKFTKLYNADDTTGLSRAAVIKAYLNGIFTRDELSDILTEFGYSPDVVSFWLSMAELDKQLKDIAALEKDLSNQFETGAIDLTNLEIQLTQADLPPSYIKTVVNKLEKSVTPKLKLPSRADLEDWLELEIIDEKYYFDQMTMLGYRETDIQNYLTEYTFVKDITTRKYLPIKTYQRWFGTAIMSEKVFLDTARLMKYSEDDITTLLMETRAQYAQVEE